MCYDTAIKNVGKERIMARKPAVSGGVQSSDLVIGVDIGGTNTVFGIVDREGIVLAEGAIPTNGVEPAENLVKRLHNGLGELLTAMGKSCCPRGIGIGAPNANYYAGTVEDPVNLNWQGITDLVALVNKYIDIPVAITNDANAAALGEMLFGSARGMRNFVAVTLGTGLGSGFIVNGDLLYGADGFAGELGHTTVTPGGRECACGKRGCLETYCSAPGLCRTVFELMSELNCESDLRAVPFHDLTARMVFEKALAGDLIAREAFARLARILGIKLADVVAITSPEAIILTGGLSLAGEFLVGPVRQAMEDHLLYHFRGKVPILCSGLPPGGSAILGAAALIWNELGKRNGTVGQ